MAAYAVIDFETTGLSPAQGARPTEIAVVLIKQDRIVDRYEALMNPEIGIPWKIQSMNGITDAMVRNAPAVSTVMREASRFVGKHPIVAHNAAFDRMFWDRELSTLGVSGNNAFICTMLLARKIYPKLANHKLETLVRSLGLPSSGTYHRALADAECTAHLLLRMKQEFPAHHAWNSWIN